MDEIKKISEDRINEISANKGFTNDLIIKDYYLTIILYLIRDISGLYFKGGTALQKTVLKYSRLSEDLDFTVRGDISKVRSKIENALRSVNFFDEITKDKDVEGFVRLVVHYKTFVGKEDSLFIDLNIRAKLIKKPEIHNMIHFYDEEIPKFSFTTLAKDEMIAEKMAATIGRNRPRDHYDLYKMVSVGIPIDINLVKKKCKQSGYEFSIIKMFNRAKKLKNRWDSDMIPLLAEEVSFETVMKTLARYFKLKELKA